MASKKIKLIMEEAGVILNYQGALHKESALAVDTSEKLIHVLRLEDNEEVYDLYEDILYKFGELSMPYQCLDIFEDLTDIFYVQKEKIHTNDLLKLKEFYGDYLKTFESNTINYLNKLKSIKNSDPELVKTEVKVIECIENMHFLTNRIIQIIDSKI